MRSRVLLPLSLLLAFSSFGRAQEHQHSVEGEFPDGLQLGSVDFPTSCSSALQNQFERAVAFLHSFQYQQSENAFHEVSRKDPGCAIACWGLAMSLWHELWDHPDPQTLKEGLAYLEKAQSLSAKTPREKDYIAAAMAFYKPPESAPYVDRASDYSRAMQRVYRRYPADGEAAAFYALSLLASEPTQDKTLKNRREAIAILQKLFAQEPDHPGAAHYLIHACDMPQFASLGLEAARRYAKVASASPHALHMPSHIFTRLGLWQESIDSNLAASAAAANLTARHLSGAYYQLHAMDFLQYAYLQAGRDADAQRLIQELPNVPGATDELLAYPLAFFPARYTLETHRWKAAADLKPTLPGVAAITYWAKAIGAARSDDASGARQDFEQLERLLDSQYGPKAFKLQREEAAAWVAYAEGRQDVALTAMRAAAADEDVGSVDSPSMPAREMLGDLLLDLRQPAQALREYEASLRGSPNRFDGLYGAARAADSAGDAEKARAYYAKLTAVCSGPASDRAEIEQARVYLARK